MADRIFGPIRGAGTQVREKEAERNIVPGVLGSTVFMGVFERGKEDDITIIPSKRALLRKMGGLLDSADFSAASYASLEAPLAAEHYWQHSDGAGFMVCFRACPKGNDATNDDRVTKASLDVFSRSDALGAVHRIATITAHNGGRWAGQRKQFLGRISGVPVVDFPLDNQIQMTGTPAKTFKRDEYKNGTVHVHGITTKTYKIVSHTSDGLFTLQPDVDLPADWAAAGPPATDYNVTIYRDDYNYRGDEKYLAVEFTDGGLDPTTYFGIKAYVDGVVFLNYENLSMDTRSPYYWVNVVNNDPNNDLFTIAEVSPFVIDRTLASSRPGNRCGLSDALTTSVLTIADPFVVSNSSAAWVPAITWTSWGTLVEPMYVCIEVTTGTVQGPIVYTLTLNCNADGTYSTGERSYTGCDMAVAVPGAGCLPVVVSDPYFGSITVDVGAGAAVVGDKIVIALRPLPVNGLVGGKVNPNTDVNREFSIVSNTRTTITVSSIYDLTNAGANTAGDPYILRYPERLRKGYDGYIAGMTLDDYNSLLDYSTSKLMKCKTLNLGLVKLAIPGIATPSPGLTTQQIARDLCLRYNWQYRVEIPDEYTDEFDVVTWLKAYGRYDLCVAHFPTQAYIRDPLADAGSVSQDKLVSLQGMILGREAFVAQQYDGYHKAAAGTDVTLPLVIRSAHLGKPDDPIRLNEEFLNPAGVNCLRWATGGNQIIVWGDRTLDTTTAMMWKHKREQLSHYENILLEGFDWAIFQINDEIMDTVIDGVLTDLFLKEYRKRALRGSTFRGGTDPACIIKIDKENNTDATRALGELNVEVSLKFADTVERLKFLMSAMGITE